MLNELEKLRKMLKDNNILYTNKSIISKNDGIDFWYKDYDISVISHKYSYGGSKGLLEIMASFIEDSVQGWLTAEQVFKMIIEKVGE